MTDRLPQPVQPPPPGGRTASDGGHGLMMIACCIPMLAIAIVLVATGVVGIGFIAVAIACTAMMALMMRGMDHGGGDHNSTHEHAANHDGMNHGSSRLSAPPSRTDYSSPTDPPAHGGRDEHSSVLSFGSRQFVRVGSSLVEDDVVSAGRRGWLLVLVAGVLAAVTSFGYLGGFLAPDTDVRALPIMIVNLDQGATIGSTSMQFGDQVVDQLRAPNSTLGDTVAWRVATSRDDALTRVREDRAYAALIIPSDFSARLVAVATTGATEPAAIEVLTNPASGSYSGAYSQAIAIAAVDQVSRQSARQLAATLDGLGVKLSPAAALTVGRPVEATVTVAHPIGQRGGRGLAPFYLAVVVVVVVAALFATSALNVAVDVAAGHQKLSLLGRPVAFGSLAAGGDAAGLLRAKLMLAGPVAAAVGVTAVAVGPLAMTVDRPWLLAGVAVLGAAATAAVTLALYAAFDLAGSVLAALFLVIYGVPSSGGVYPVEALPSFFRFLHSWLPLRYLTDAARALTFGGGPPSAVGRAAVVLVAYMIAGVLMALATARYTGRSRTSGPALMATPTDRP